MDDLEFIEHSALWADAISDLICGMRPDLSPEIVYDVIYDKIISGEFLYNSAQLGEQIASITTNANTIQ